MMLLGWAALLLWTLEKMGILNFISVYFFNLVNTARMITALHRGNKAVSVKVPPDPRIVIPDKKITQLSKKFKSFSQAKKEQEQSDAS